MLSLLRGGSFMKGAYMASTSCVKAALSSETVNELACSKSLIMFLRPYEAALAIDTHSLYGKNGWAVQATGPTWLRHLRRRTRHCQPVVNWLDPFVLHR